MWKMLKPKILLWIRGLYDKKLVTLLILGGISTIGGATSPWWNAPLVELINSTLNSNIPIPDQKANPFLIIPFLIAGLIMIRWGLKYRQRTKSKNKRMVQIRHSSVESANYTSIDDDLTDYDIVLIEISQVAELREATDFNLKMAWKKQDQFVEDIKVHINEPSTNSISYMGMAHIPFQFLLGYQIADKTDVRFYEWNRTIRTWMPLSESAKAFPILHLNRDESKQGSNEVREIVIKISISFRITDAQLIGHQVQSLNTYTLALDPPQLDVVRSVQQLNTYKQQFRDLLTEIHHKYENLKRVHIYMSASPSVSYSFGSCISARMDSSKDFWIYNYVGSSKIPYPWGIKIAKELNDGEIKLL